MADPSESAKQVICEIIQANGNQFPGKTRLFKAFYFAHLYYWRDGEGVLTTYPIVRLPQGPGIDKGEDLLAELMREGKIRISHQFNGPYTEHSYELMRPVEVDVDSPRHRALLQAVAFVESRTATDLSELTHENSRSWQEASNGDALNIYIDLLDDCQYEAIQKRVKEMQESAGGVFSDLS